MDELHTEFDKAIAALTIDPTQRQELEIQKKNKEITQLQSKNQKIDEQGSQIEKQGKQIKKLEEALVKQIFDIK